MHLPLDVNISDRHLINNLMTVEMMCSKKLAELEKERGWRDKQY